MCQTPVVQDVNRCLHIFTGRCGLAETITCFVNLVQRIFKFFIGHDIGVLDPTAVMIPSTNRRKIRLHDSMPLSSASAALCKV